MLLAEAKSKAEWSHTAALLAMTANVNRDSKKRPQPYTSDDFNPHARRAKQKVFTKANVQALKALLP